MNSGVRICATNPLCEAHTGSIAIPPTSDEVTRKVPPAISNSAPIVCEPAPDPPAQTPSLPVTVVPADFDDVAASSTSAGGLSLSIEEVIERLGFGPFQFFAALFCFLGWFCFGASLYNAVVFSPVVTCIWELSESEESLISTMYAVGAICACCVMGAIGDKFGRKLLLIPVFSIHMVFSVLSAIPAFSSKDIGLPWLVVCRFGFGLAYGSGISILCVYVAEVVPIKARGACIFILQMFLAFGSIAAAITGLFVIKSFGWQIYSGLTTIIPGAIVFVTIWFIPESPRYLISKGQQTRAQRILCRIAKINGKSTLITLIENGVDFDTHGTVEERKDNKEAGSRKAKPFLVDIFNKDFRRTTLLLIYLWFAGAILYSGSLWLPTSILQYDFLCGTHNSSNNYSSFINSSDSFSNCTIDNNYYIQIAWTASAEIPGLILVAIMIEVLGRKLSISVSFFGAMSSILLLLICVPNLVTTVFLFSSRWFTTGGYIAMIVYSCEAYPTHIRGRGSAIFALCAGIGATIAPLVAQVVIHLNYYATIGVYAGLALTVSICGILLPIETKGKYIACMYQFFFPQT